MPIDAAAIARTAAGQPSPTAPRKTHRMSIRVTGPDDTFVRMMADKHGTTRSGYVQWLVKMQREMVTP